MLVLEYPSYQIFFSSTNFLEGYFLYVYLRETKKWSIYLYSYLITLFGYSTHLSVLLTPQVYP